MFCTHCGAEIINSQAEICVKCGCRIAPQKFCTPSVVDDTMSIVIKVFMLIGCISLGWLLVPLAWCIPMTVSVFKSLSNNKPISTGMKVCVLLFVNIVAGICLLCDDNK